MSDVNVEKVASIREISDNEQSCQFVASSCISYPLTTSPHGLFFITELYLRKL